MTKTIYAPHPLEPANMAVFLAGSIDMGFAEDWQTWAIHNLQDAGIDIIYNPRRPDWDRNWKQSEDDPNTNAQINWELDAIEASDVVAFYFAEHSKAPISFLELGLTARENKAVVFCPDGFYRQANVSITCKKYGVPIYKNKNSWLAALMHKIDVTALGKHTKYI